MSEPVCKNGTTAPAKRMATVWKKKKFSNRPARLVRPMPLLARLIKKLMAIKKPSRSWRELWTALMFARRKTRVVNGIQIPKILQANGKAARAIEFILTTNWKVVRPSKTVAVCITTSRRLAMWRAKATRSRMAVLNMTPKAKAVQTAGT